MRHDRKLRGNWRCLPAVAGKRIRRFFALESDAYAEGARLTRQIRDRGVESLTVKEGMALKKAVALFNEQFRDYSKSHREKVEKVTRWLAKDIGGALAGVTPMRCLEWFRGIDGVSTSRATVFRWARLFWNWCVKVDLIDKSLWRPVQCPRPLHLWRPHRPRHRRTPRHARIAF